MFQNAECIAVNLAAVFSAAGSGINGAAIFTLLLLLGAAAVFIVLLVRRVDTLQKAFSDVQQSRSELASFLSRFSTGIRGDEGFDGVMHTAAQNIAEKINANSVCIYGYRDGKLIATGVSGTYPLVHGSSRLLFTRRVRLMEALHREKIVPGEGFLGKMLVHQQPRLVPDAGADADFSGYPDLGNAGSVMAVPMIRDGLFYGIICAVGNRARSGHTFSGQQFERLRSFATETMMVQDLVQVYADISQKDRIDQELQFARHIQMSLLPDSFPQWGNFSIDARTRSAKEVNGDYYDFVRIDDDRLLIVIGDACGKGVPACMLTAMTRSFASTLGDSFTTLTDFLRDLNRKLYRDTDGDRFITVGCCLLNKKESLLEFGRAGHTDFISHVHNHIRVISPDGNALGILPDEFVNYETLCISLDPGSTVMMFSDGLTEATNAFEEEFGTGRLIDAFQRSCEQRSEARDIIDDVMNAVAAFEKEQADDQTVVLIRQTGRAGSDD